MKRNRFLLIAAVAVLIAVAAGLLETRSSGASDQQAVVKTAKNAKLHSTILVTLGGRTLYSLSAERNGRFICTDATCLSLWKPLHVARGMSPSGVKGLSLVTRPDHTRQVAYKGAPLYTFTGDKAAGQANGNGFKDVGTWRVITVSGSAAAPQTTTNGYGYGY
jgi:predicted lipoprotein with Yx(FWY)xxD motif